MAQRELCDRLARYLRKTQPDHVRDKLRMRRGEMAQSWVSTQAEMDEIRRQVKEMLCRTGADGLTIAAYYAFALQIYGRLRRFSNARVLALELEGLLLLWTNRGLNSSLLRCILLEVFELDPVLLPAGKGAK